MSAVVQNWAMILKKWHWNVTAKNKNNGNDIISHSYTDES